MRTLRTLIPALLTCSLLTPCLQAQFSKTLVEDRDNPQLQRFTDYEAVIIEDIGNISFVYTENGFESRYERCTRYKINTSSGLDWMEVEIPLYTEGYKSEHLLSASAEVLNPGRAAPVTYNISDLDIFRERYRENTVLEKFVVPNVQEGALVDICYKYSSPYLFNLDDWIFQYSIPVVHSKLQLYVIPFYTYAILKRGSHNIDKYYAIDLQGERQLGPVKYQDRLHVFSMTDIPAFEDESFITNRLDYIDRMEFQMLEVTNTQGIKTQYMTDWISVNKDMLKASNLGKYVSSAKSHSKSAARELASPGTDARELTDRITGYVRENLRWNGQNSKFASAKPKAVFSKREGNAADINLYLVGMLQAAGLEAFPVMVSTREHGRVFNDRPLHRSFNYVIAAVRYRGEYLLRDATDGDYPCADLPVRCLNGKGLLVNSDSEEWIPLGKGIRNSGIIHTVKSEPVPGESSLRCDIRIESEGYDAIGFRKAWRKAGGYPEEMFDWNRTNEIDSLLIRTDLERVDSASVWARTSATLESADGLLFIEPFAGLPEKQCPLTKLVRNYPVDMIYPRKRCYRAEIVIPEGYLVSHVPEKYSLENDLLVLKYIPTETDTGSLLLEAELSFKKRMYSTKDYGSLRYFYDDMVQRLNQKVTLEPEPAAEP